MIRPVQLRETQKIDQPKPASAEPRDHQAAAEQLRSDFASHLPRVEDHARFSFRHWRCPHKREDAVSEVVALAWLWFVRLTRRGKDPSQFVSVLANLAARAVKCGRRLCGQEKSRDVLSPRAQCKGHFTVRRLAAGDPDLPYHAALRDNTQTPVPEQVIFRCDFPRWLASLSERDRRLVDELVLGERTGDVARQFGLSPARVSQLRRHLHHDWQLFCCERPAQSATVPA